MTDSIQAFAPLVGEEIVDHLRQLAAPLRGKTVVNVNSTRYGGGVAEILTSLVPYMRDLELDVHWETISGEQSFFQCTKSVHNSLQGAAIDLTEEQKRVYEETNARNAEALRPKLQEADIVIIHDPQPVPLLRLIPEHKGKWIWRCHIDLSEPYRPAWDYIQPFVAHYDASVFSLVDFAQRLPHFQPIIAPAIDPFSVKNIDLPQEEIAAIHARYGIDPDRPRIVQVSRYDRFKDPIGVIQAYRIAKAVVPALQLVLCGGEAADDPEGQQMLSEVMEAAGNDRDIHVLMLSTDIIQRTTNGLQRIADVILQKSLREGFGLTVTEGMWKQKPVIGGRVGGIRLQIHEGQTGFLVDTPEGAALRIGQLFHKPEMLRAIGQRARRHVEEHFLMTRKLRDYLCLFNMLLFGVQSNPVQFVNGTFPPCTTT